MIICASMLILPGSIITSQIELKRAKKKQEACCKGLKCLNKKPVVALSIELSNCCRVLFIKSMLLISPKIVLIAF